MSVTKASQWYPRTVRAGDRATEFKQRCTGLGIKGVSLVLGKGHKRSNTFVFGDSSTGPDLISGKPVDF